MPRIVAVTREDGTPVCRRCRVADRPLARLRGLLGRRALPPDAGLLLRPASAIHTCGMRFAIDAVFLDADGAVLRVAADLGPWRMAACRGARSVLELPAGTCARQGLRAGDHVVIAAGEAGR